MGEDGEKTSMNQIINIQSLSTNKNKSMKKLQTYASIINEAKQIATEYISTPDSIRRINTAKDNLLKEMESNTFIKVPFVGDFDAGKSSLLNAMMGVELLPTDILPTTAVSYELYYSVQEQLKIFHKGELKETTPLSQISSLKVVPGDVVYVYINNEFVRNLNERGIVIVDMPGIDSGIEAHNNAILNYISEGSFFFLVTDAEQGTLRHSAIRFVDELKKYNLSCNVIISKADKKPETDIERIKTEVEEQAKRTIRDDIEVGVTSAAANQFKDVNNMLNQLNAEKIFANKFSKEIAAFVSDIISELQLQIRLALSNKKDFTAQIEALKAERNKALDNLQIKNRDAQPLSSSAEDILDDVREAIITKSSYLANLLYQNNNNTDAFSNELLAIIRPVLVNSFKREISEYQDVIGDSVREFSLNVNEILQDKDNPILEGANEIVGNLLGKDVLENLLKKGLDKLITKLAAYKGLSTLLKSLSKILGPLITIIINVIPDLLRLVFGKSKEQKIEAIQQKIISDVVGKIIATLREPVISMLEEQRKSSMNEMETLIEEESKKFNDNVKQMQQEQQASDAEITAKVQKLENGINRLNQLTVNL